jgi:TRAP-type transport system periplasmic protein
VMSLHYLFRDENHLRKSIADPGVVNAIKDMIAASVQGAHVLCVETLGFRYIYSKNEYHKVDDLKGVKIRVQATKTEDAMFPAYGAQTVHMPFGEVYTSLQTGVVQAAENGINVYLSNKHYEVAPIMSMTEHEANNGFIWVSDKLWSSLSDEEKRWTQAAADEVARVQPDQALQLEKDSAVKLEKLGIKFVRDVDKSGFVAAAKPIQQQLANELGPHAVKIKGLIEGVR